MKRTAPFVLAALLAGLALAATAAGSRSTSGKAVILGMSHTHPTGSTFSWVCAKVKKTGAKKASLVVSGPGLLDTESHVRKLKSGTHVYAFKIGVPGRYRFTARQGTHRDKDSYTVPPPPKPAQGKFPCV